MSNIKRKEIYSQWPYIFWFLFYFTLFWILFGANWKSFGYVLFIYTVSILFAVSPVAETLWRNITGVRCLATSAEKNRLMPLFEEVYGNALNADNRLSKGIQLFIEEDMEVNAFAFGKNTLVLTRGSIELLSDDCLKGLMAHEFGHFSHLDTFAILIASVGNLLLSLVMKMITGIARILLYIVRKKDATFTFIFKILYRLLMAAYSAINFFGDVILMSVSREHEFMADAFAMRCGYGQELTYVLYQLHDVSIKTPERIVEQLRSTHPPLVQRIRRLEQQMQIN